MKDKTWIKKCPARLFVRVPTTHGYRTCQFLRYWKLQNYNYFPKRKILESVYHIVLLEMRYITP